MEREIEKVKITGFALESIFNKNFLDKIEKIGGFFPVNVVFVRESDKNKDVEPAEMIMGIKNSVEKKEKIIHIELNDSKILEEIIKSLND